MGNNSNNGMENNTQYTVNNNDYMQNYDYDNNTENIQYLDGVEELVNQNNANNMAVNNYGQDHIPTADIDGSDMSYQTTTDDSGMGYDVIASASGSVEDEGNAVPQSVVVNYQDVLRARLLKDAKNNMVYAPKAVTDPLYEKYNNDSRYMNMFEDVDEGDAICKRMLVSDYAKVKYDEIIESFTKTKNNVEDFYEKMVAYANDRMKNSNYEESGIDTSFINFINDKFDSVRIADTFAQPGSELEKYDHYVDVPVPILAIHTIFSNGSIELNSDGTVNKTSYKKLVSNLGDDKMVEFASELCGLEISTSGRVVRRTQYEYPDRAAYFNSMLPAIINFVTMYKEDYELLTLIANAQCQALLLNVDDECSRYIEGVVTDEDIPEIIRKKIDRVVEDFGELYVSKERADQLSLVQDIIIDDTNLKTIQQNLDIALNEYNKRFDEMIASFSEDEIFQQLKSEFIRKKIPNEEWIKSLS